MLHKNRITVKKALEMNWADVLSRRGFIKVSACVAGAFAAMSATKAIGAPPLIIMERATGMIIGDPTLCVSCQLCELACTEFNDGKADPALARIKITRNLNFGPGGASGRERLGMFGNGLDVQDTCRQCPHPVPCATACPQDAIIAAPGSGTRVVDAKKCVGCRLCQTACPWGMMSFDNEKGKASKCFLCNGNPKCVAVCPSQSLRYVPWHDLTKTMPPRVPVMSVTPANKAAACAACHS